MTEGSTAEISGDGVYRFRLSRRIELPARVYDDVADEWRWSEPIRVLVVVMLNPSTADAMLDDPTIRRIKAYARAWGYHEVVVVNLYAYRTASPVKLWQAWARGVDIVGVDNDSAISKAVGLATDRVLCGWGKGPAMKRERAFHLERVAAVRKLIGSKANVLMLNQDGSPAHPLYLPHDLQPMPWSAAA